MITMMTAKTAAKAEDDTTRRKARRKMTNTTTTRRYPFLYEMNHENHTHGTGRALLYSKGAAAFGGAPCPCLLTLAPCWARGRHQGQKPLGGQKPGQGQRPYGWPPMGRLFLGVRWLVRTEKCLHQLRTRPPLVRLYMITMAIAPNLRQRLMIFLRRTSFLMDSSETNLLQRFAVFAVVVVVVSVGCTTSKP